MCGMCVGTNFLNYIYVRVSPVLVYFFLIFVSYIFSYIFLYLFMNYIHVRVSPRYAGSCCCEFFLRVLLFFCLFSRCASVCFASVRGCFCRMQPPTRVQQDYNRERPRAGRGAARCGAGSTVRERRSSINLRLLQHPLTRTRAGCLLQLTRRQLLLRESMRRERPARRARTALRPLPLPRRGRKRRAISGSRTDMSHMTRK